MEKLTDFELFKVIKGTDKVLAKKATDCLYTRYEKAIWKQKHKMDAVMKASNIYGLDTDDYFSDTYETFLRAVKSIKLEKVPVTKQKTWKFYVALNGYLMSHNRDSIAHHLKRAKNEVSLNTTVSYDDSDMKGNENDSMLFKKSAFKSDMSPEEEFFENKRKTAFWKAVEVSRKAYSPIENKIWDLRSQSLKKNEICQKVNIEMSALNKHLRNMKTVLTNNIQKYSDVSFQSF